MAEILVRLVTTVKVDDHAWEMADQQAVQTAVGQFVFGVAMPNANCECAADWGVVCIAHHHYSDEQSNCEFCIEHAMDEEN